MYKILPVIPAVSMYNCVISADTTVSGLPEPVKMVLRLTCAVINLRNSEDLKVVFACPSKNGSNLSKLLINVQHQI